MCACTTPDNSGRSTMRNARRFGDAEHTLVGVVRCLGPFNPSNGQQRSSGCWRRETNPWPRRRSRSALGLAKGTTARAVAHAAGCRFRSTKPTPRTIPASPRTSLPWAGPAGSERAALPLAQLDRRARGAERRGGQGRGVPRGPGRGGPPRLRARHRPPGVATGSSCPAARAARSARSCSPSTRRRRATSSVRTASLTFRTVTDRRRSQRVRRRPRLGLRGPGRRSRARPGRHRRAGARPRRLRRRRVGIEGPTARLCDERGDRGRRWSRTSSGPGQVDLPRARATGRTLVKAARYIAALDQGTTSTRCMLFDQHGRMVALAQREHRQYYPHPAWVEHDAAEIWSIVQRILPRRWHDAGVAPGADRRAWGSPTSARRRCVWNRHTGKPVSRAIVWQDTRTAGAAARIRRGPTRRSSTTSAACRWPTTSPAAKLRWLLDATRRCASRPKTATCCSAPSTPGSPGTSPAARRRPARHRRDQRQPHHADEPRDAGLGRRLLARRVPHPAPDAARDPSHAGRFRHHRRSGPGASGSPR